MTMCIKKHKRRRQISFLPREKVIKQLISLAVFSLCVFSFPLSSSAMFAIPLPTLSESPESGFADDPVSPGITPNEGVALNIFTFKVVYESPINFPPSILNLIVSDGTTTTAYPMTLDTTATLTNGDYTDGEQFIYQGVFPQGAYTYYVASDFGVDLPLTGEWVFTVTAPIAMTCVAGTDECYSNVLFLPGIEGSRLYEPLVCNDAGSLCKTEQLWEPHGDKLALRLAHEVNGSSTNADIYTHDIIDNAYVPLKGNIYKSFAHDMEQLKNEHTIADWKAISYDWRLTPDQILESGKVIYEGERISYLEATTSPYIIQELHRLAASSKTGKVTIVAHSNGGLITKRLTEILGPIESVALIDKIIFVAVPQAGTPKAIGALLHGFDQALPVDWLQYALSPEVARSLAKNMPMAYNLLPSANYFTQVDDPVVTFDDSLLLAPWRERYGEMVHSRERLRTFITDQSRIVLPVSDDLIFPISGNEALLNSAETLHDNLDDWTPPLGVQLYEIAGWGVETVKTITYYQGRKTFCSDPADIHTCTDTPALFYDTKKVLDGDGTVVVPSALWTATSTGVKKYWVNLQEYNGFFGGIKHADILEVDPLRMFIQDIVTNKSLEDLSTYNHISTSTPPNKDADTRLSFSLHSPLSLNLYDTFGNHTGISTTTGEFEENIPGSHYETFGEVKYISAPASSTPRLIMNGYATGSFTLDIEEKQGETIIASTTFSGIPSSTSTIVIMNFSSGTIREASALAIDENGDGRTDLSLLPRLDGIATLDLTPPEAVLAFSTSMQALLLSGIDDSGLPISISVSTTTRHKEGKDEDTNDDSQSSTTVTFSDASGNILVIPFIKYQTEKQHIILSFNALIYNGSTTTVATTTLKYQWEKNKKGTYTMFSTAITIGATTTEARYNPKMNTTIIAIRRQEGDDEEPTINLKLPGMVTLSLVTKNRAISITY